MNMYIDLYGTWKLCAFKNISVQGVCKMSHCKNTNGNGASLMNITLFCASDVYDHVPVRNLNRKYVYRFHIL